MEAAVADAEDKLVLDGAVALGTDLHDRHVPRVPDQGLHQAARPAGVMESSTGTWSESSNTNI